MSDPAVREMFREKNIKIESQARLITDLLEVVEITKDFYITILSCHDQDLPDEIEELSKKAREILNSDAVKQFKGE